MMSGAPEDGRGATLVATVLATGFGAGLSPLAPGTAGTLVAVPLALLLAPLLASGPGPALAVLVPAAAVAVWSAGVEARRTGLKDPGRVVVDEIAGFFVAVAALPATPTVLVAAFALFRLFDITKPPPCRRAEALPGGLGIVADDLVAGFYANLALRGLLAGGWLSP